VDLYAGGCGRLNDGWRKQVIQQQRGNGKDGSSNRNAEGVDGEGHEDVWGEHSKLT